MKPTSPTQAELVSERGSTLREPLPSARPARRNRTLQSIGVVALLAGTADFVVAGHSQAAGALAFRLLWCVGLVTLGHHLPGLSRTAQSRATAAADLLSAVCWLGVVYCTGGAKSYLLPWSLALPLAISFVSREFVMAALLSSSLAIAGTLAMQVMAGETRAELFGWCVMGLASLGIAALEGASFVRATRAERRLTRSRIEALEMLAVETRARLQAEAELSQAQKLESIGRLAAGLAHEINTPVQYVSDSLHFLREASNDLLAVVNKMRVVHRAVLGGTPTMTAATEATNAEEAADLPYLLENMPKAFDRSVEGLNRVTGIVRSMKEFAHPDQKEMTSVDLNRAIESTLTIARGEYKLVAEMKTSLGIIPLVRCYAGEINQALLNILINAAHAVEEVVLGTDQKGLIRVATVQDGDGVAISISDTGAGIPESIRERIFDPFFTTKEVGKGTGQGLAIARSVIVGKHRGRLTFQTKLGEGTMFTIWLPVDGKPT